ncbi:uncharacterized protein BYT42DRAFT_203194 [Radiomyces spectabilis]|uniref:uncharacterized protein n=1 Tax=Radiomyces spectabilis TaxID=64574 RepID=UPI00221F516C|nr:uncharacterized protein BYT42DRAFT_203194 [Radiomyces spectabilis]KAI8391657.1 hypothetical protein BYT42DRAFT_203194 [Radiomyces spectabilis]
MQTASGNLTYRYCRSLGAHSDVNMVPRTKSFNRSISFSNSDFLVQNFHSHDISEYVIVDRGESVLQEFVDRTIADCITEFRHLVTGEDGNPLTTWITTVLKVTETGTASTHAVSERSGFLQLVSKRVRRCKMVVVPSAEASWSNALHAIVQLHWLIRSRRVTS